MVKDGKMDASKKYRGKIEKVINNYVHDFFRKSLKPAREELSHLIVDPVRWVFCSYRSKKRIVKSHSKSSYSCEIVSQIRW